MHGDPDGALRDADRCLKISPTAASCIRRRADVFTRRGQCAMAEAEARLNVAAEPRGPSAYEYLANALASRGAPLDSVRDALRKRSEVVDDPELKREYEIQAAMLLANYTGDFPAREQAIHDLEALRANDASESARATDTLIFLYDEEGNTSKAILTAEDFLKRSPAWLPDNPGGARPIVLDTLHRAGRISEDDFAAKRDAWIREERAKYAPFHANEAWIDFYARVAHTPADATAALDALPRFSPLPPPETSSEQTWVEEPMGRVYLLAGRIDEAVDHLRRATAGCAQIGGQYVSVPAHEELGEALEAKGDKEGACTEYAAVLARWGSARPRSVTADKARARARALGCNKT